MNVLGIYERVVDLLHEVILHVLDLSVDIRTDHVVEVAHLIAVYGNQRMQRKDTNLKAHLGIIGWTSDEWRG